MVGQTLSRYRILETLGAGGMGVVYRAHDPTLDRDVALKVLQPQVLASEAGRKRFVAEALALSRLNHPHVCTVYEIGESDGQTFIAMEYVKGRTLSSLIPAGGLPVETLLRYGAQISDALAHAHEHGIVHRDLKSANVMVTSEGVVKVLDFGLARRLHTADDAAALTRSDVTAADTMLGTPAYMAPEVLLGSPADVRADVWGLGVILHETAVGSRPFAGTTTAGLTSAILKEPPGPLPPRVPPGLQAVIQRCLAKEPGQRYQAIGEVRAALDALATQTSAIFQARVRASRWSRGWMFGSAAAIAGLAITLAVTFGLRRMQPSPGEIRSIAVLPLENLSGDPEQEYFADGMTEQLTADLAGLSGLRVISRTSVMQYKKARKPLPIIAEELNVDAIVEGSVTSAGDKVRITAKLVKAATDQSLWAQSYERDLREVLALQAEVARAIAGEIDVTLTPQEEAGLASNRRVDPAAHQSYLLGRFHLDRASEDGARKAIQYFEQVIAKDNRHAGAYVGLADSHIFLSSYSIERPRDAIPKAKAAALAALRLDDGLAEAHAALGTINFFYDWDGPAAERELRRAIELRPSLAAAHMFYAGYLLAVRRTEAAVPEIRRALELDPRSLTTHAYGTIFLIFARRNDEAIELGRKALELEPNFSIGMTFQGLAYAEQRRFQEAVANLRRATQLDKNPRVLLFGSHVHAVAGDRKEAERLLQEAHEVVGERYFCPYEIACAYVSLGKHDEAYEWLKKGVQERADCMPWLGVEPWLDPFRSDPRYSQLLQQVGLAPPPAPTRTP
jgi:eukaryotic-like serine/threonine-protein kinase